MAPGRPYWKGYLKLALVSCPIALYTASSSSERVSFRQINKKTGTRTTRGRQLRRPNKVLKRPNETLGTRKENGDRSLRHRWHHVGVSSFSFLQRYCVERLKSNRRCAGDL